VTSAGWSGISVGTKSSLRPEVSEALNEKLGRVDADLLCAIGTFRVGGELACIDAGRRLAAGVGACELAAT